MTSKSPIQSSSQHEEGRNEFLSKTLRWFNEYHKENVEL